MQLEEGVRIWVLFSSASYWRTLEENGPVDGRLKEI